MNDPVKHHYLTIFYLNRWAGEGEDKEVFRFWRPNGDKLISGCASPKRSAFEKHLYSVHTPNRPPNPAMEKDFMSRLDSDAAVALGFLKDRLPASKWEPRYRSAWSRFISAQLIRTPSEVAQLKSLVKEPSEKITPGLKEAYEMNRPDGAPESVDDYLATLESHEVDHFALGILRQCMDNPRIGQFINNMHWKVLDFEGCGVPLLTSDSPVWMNPAFAEPDPAIVMPIGPTSLFVATRDTETMLRIEAQNRRQRAKEVNRAIVQHAVNFVFGEKLTMNDKTKAFVQRHFATQRPSTPMERIAVEHGHRIVAEDSPLRSLNNEVED